jgi:hypothetical protein
MRRSEPGLRLMFSAPRPPSAQVAELEEGQRPAEPDLANFPCTRTKPSAKHHPQLLNYISNL